MADTKSIPIPTMVLLNLAEDWPISKLEFISAAIGVGICQYIDLDSKYSGEGVPKLEIPSFSFYKIKYKNRGPMWNNAPVIKTRLATHFTKLKKEDKEAHQAKMALYNTHKKQWHLYTRSKQELYTWCYLAVGQHFKNTYCKVENTIGKWYKAF